MWPKNMWKRIPYIMQQHETPKQALEIRLTRSNLTKLQKSYKMKVL